MPATARQLARIDMLCDTIDGVYQSARALALDARGHRADPVYIQERLDWLIDATGYLLARVINEEGGHLPATAPVLLQRAAALVAAGPSADGLT